jgi:hypothetical protein
MTIWLIGVWQLSTGGEMTGLVAQTALSKHNEIRME